MYGSQLRRFGVGTMAFQASEDVSEVTHALRVRVQRAHRIGVLRIKFDGPLRQGDCPCDRAPRGPPLRRISGGYQLRRAHRVGM